MRYNNDKRTYLLMKYNNQKIFSVIKKNLNLLVKIKIVLMHI